MYNLFNLLYFPDALPLQRSDLKVFPSGVCEYVVSSDSGINWVVVSSSQLTKNTAYVVNSFTLTNLTLPVIGLAQGDRIIIADQGTGGFQINQATGEQIKYGNKETTIGITGRIVSSEPGNAIELIFLGLKWVVAPGSIGNFDVI